MKRALPLTLALCAVGGAATAADVTRTYGAPTAPIAATVTVPAGYETIYLSGMTPTPMNPGSAAAPQYGDTEHQTESALMRIRDTLKAQGLGFGDVVMMHVYLVGDPMKGGVMDFSGMMAAYTRHFGTPDQPNRPSRSTVQVSALAGAGVLVEIEVIAARKPAP